MRRVMLILAVLAMLGLVTGTAMAGHPAHGGSHVEVTLIGHHGGHYYHHGPHYWHPAPAPVVVYPPAYRPAVIVPAPAPAVVVPAPAPAYVAPRDYFYAPQSHGGISVFGRKFGVSVDF